MVLSGLDAIIIPRPQKCSGDLIPIIWRENEIMEDKGI